MKKRIVLSALLVIMIAGFASVTYAQSKRQALITKIANLVSSGDSSTITLADGTQLFVSMSGTLITSTARSITASTVGIFTTSYDDLVSEIADFLDEAITDSKGEFDPEQEFSSTT